MTLLVCGSRDWSDPDVIREILRMAVREWSVERIVHGNCRGADRMAADEARWLGIPVAAFPVVKADGPWPAAGPRRNARMLETSNPDVAVAFSVSNPLTPGTHDMTMKCLAAGIPTFMVLPDCSMTQMDKEP